MHPLLARAGRLAAYLVAWAPLTAMLVYLIAVPGGFGIAATALVIVPSSAVYAFVCLSTRFSCRLLPMDKSGTLRVLVIHGAGAGCAGWLWSGATLAYSRAALGWSGAGASEQARFAAQAGPLILGAGVLLYLLSVALNYVQAAAEARREAERREREARILASEAELRALKAQLNPHFLFNSLNSISALTSTNPAAAREMCVLLADFLRSTLGMGDRDAIPLRDELSLARCFLAVERVRFGSRLCVEEEVEKSAENCLVPPLVLQPLVENAVKHGVASLPEGGLVRLEAKRVDGRLSVSIENTFDPDSPRRRKSGVGLENVRRRLETRYGEDASLRIFTAENRYRARLSLPLEEAHACASSS